MIVIRGTAGDSRVIKRLCRGTVVQRTVDETPGVWIIKYDTTLRHKRAAMSDRCAGLWQARLTTPIGGSDNILIGVAGVDEDIQIVLRGAEGSVVLLSGTVSLTILTGVAAEFEALKIMLGDDVDHTGYRIGTIDRRRTIVQHFDAFDNADRDGVQVHVTGYTGSRCPRNPAIAVYQHQRPLGTQMSEIDAGRAGTDATAVRRKAEVAAAVELRVQRRAGYGQALQNVCNAG